MNPQFGMQPPLAGYGMPPGPPPPGPPLGPQMNMRPAQNGVDSFPAPGPPMGKPFPGPPGGIQNGPSVSQNGPLSKPPGPQSYGDMGKPPGIGPPHPNMGHPGMQRPPLNNNMPSTATPDHLTHQMGGLSMSPGQPPQVPMQPGIRPQTPGQELTNIYSAPHPGAAPPGMASNQGGYYPPHSTGPPPHPVGPPAGLPPHMSGPQPGPSGPPRPPFAAGPPLHTPGPHPHSDGLPPRSQPDLSGSIPPQAGYPMQPRPPAPPGQFSAQPPMGMHQNRFSVPPPQGSMPNSGAMPPPNVNMNIGGPPPPASMNMNIGMPQSNMGPPQPGTMGYPPPQPGMMPPGSAPQTNGTVGAQLPYSGMQSRYPQQPQQQQQQPTGAYQPGMGGVPPQPAMMQANRAAPQMPAPTQQQQQQQQQQQSQQGRRLDPDQMPSPIQVIQDDKKNRSGDFYTNSKGQVPPLVTTEFSVHDEGICSPRFMRSTIYSVPCSPDILKQTAVPFAVSVCPFAEVSSKEMSPPISNLGDSGPVRCNRCKAYMCAFMQFIDGGRRFQCVFCKGTTEVPPEYFAHLDHTGHRMDKFQRAELCLGSFEFIATKEYCRNGQLPKPPAFIFMIEATFCSIKNGMLPYLCQKMKEVLANLPREVSGAKSEIRVGFVTYNSVIHFYNVKGTLAQPQMMVVPDVNEMFVPLVDGFLVTLEESEAVIDSLMEQIPAMFADTRETEVILGPVIQAGLEALKAADTCGKLFIFHTSLPIAEAPGKLKNRDDRKLLATDKEKTILTPQNTFYNTLGQECVTAACCVDLFLFANSYVDIATIGQVCRLTGGQVYKYMYFQMDLDGQRFLEDLCRDVSKPIAFDAIMRIRTSTGIRPTDFFGNYYMSNTTDVELAAIDCDKAISVEIKYDDKLTEEDGAYLQTAVLYTSCSGQRRLRIHNLALGVCTQMADLYRNCELDTIVNFLAKQALRLLMDQTPRQVKESMVNRAAQILATYRKNCASPSSVGQLILPECMKLLPLYNNCLIKSDALAGGSDMATDDRSHFMFLLNSMDVVDTVGYFYPRLLPLHDLNPEETSLPVALRCSVEKVREHGAYLLENGVYLFLWVGNNVNVEWLQDVFAVQATARIDPEKPVLLELNTDMSKRVRAVIDQVRKERKRCMRLIIIRQGDKLEIVFRQFLVEDRTGENGSSYVDFLCHLHKEIRNLLS